MNSPVQQWPYGDQGASAVPVTVSRIGLASSAQLISGAGLIIAITLANNSTTTPVWIALGDGTDANGYIVASLAAPAGGGLTMGIAPAGIPFSRGIYLTHHLGTYDLTVTYVHLDSIP